MRLDAGPVGVPGAVPLPPSVPDRGDQVFAGTQDQARPHCGIASACQVGFADVPHGRVWADGHIDPCPVLVVRSAVPDTPKHAAHLPPPGVPEPGRADEGPWSSGCNAWATTRI